MLYTIGNCENYDKGLLENNLVKGVGGSVWKDLKSIIEYYSLNKTCFLNNKEVQSSIYIVDGDWNVDVNIKSNSYGVLIHPCKIISKLK